MSKRRKSKVVSPAKSLHLNRNYKDRLFRFIFSKKEDLLDLYNAINGTHYDNPDELIITTLEGVVFLGMKNDISFLIDCTMNLYEHQSTMNPNIPLRGFFYFSDIMREYVAARGMDIYSSRLLKLPLPQYIVFYNGTKNEPDRSVLCLSDAFEREGDASLECKATMLNINYGHNQELMERCRRLEEYSYFVLTVRRYTREGYSANEAANKAVDECIERGKLADILSRNRREVINMLLREFDYEKYKKLVKKEAYEDGWEEGREEGRIAGREEGRIAGREEWKKELIAKKMAKGFTPEAIADILEEDIDEIQKLILEIREGKNER